MPSIRKLTLLAAPAALLALSACATPFRADVARFQLMPAPQGQSFTIQAMNPNMQGGLEFSQYAALVSQKLTALGYVPRIPLAKGLPGTVAWYVDNAALRDATNQA